MRKLILAAALSGSLATVAARKGSSKDEFTHKSGPPFEKGSH